MTSPRKIITDFVYPPIPVRQFDWQAYFDGEEETGNYGFGATEAEAIAALIESIDDQEEYDAQLAAVRGAMVQA